MKASSRLILIFGLLVLAACGNKNATTTPPKKNTAASTVTSPSVLVDNTTYTIDDTTDPNGLLTIYRLRKEALHMWSFGANEATDVGYVAEGAAFHTYAGYAAGRVPIFRCYIKGTGGHFVSLDSNCEGTLTEYYMGYVYSSPQPGLMPLYRKYSGASLDHLVTVTQNEGDAQGYAMEGILGYVQ